MNMLPLRVLNVIQLQRRTIHQVTTPNYLQTHDLPTHNHRCDGRARLLGHPCEAVQRVAVQHGGLRKPWFLVL